MYLLILFFVDMGFKDSVRVRRKFLIRDAFEGFFAAIFPAASAAGRNKGDGFKFTGRFRG